MISVLPVGYADCILLKFPNGKHAMIDAGSAESAGTVLAELKSRQIQMIDLLLITHFHDNHYGGLAEIAGQIKIEQIATPSSAEEPEDLRAVKARLISSGTQLMSVRKGDTIKIDPAVTFTILHPEGVAQNPNEDSVVTLILFKAVSLLFPADIPPKVQTQILPDLKKHGSVDFVLLPHHGGELDPEFADWIEHSIKLISSGPSRWTSPDPRTLERFGKNLRRTDLHGTLSYQTAGDRLIPAEIPAHETFSV